MNPNTEKGDYTEALSTLPPAEGSQPTRRGLACESRGPRVVTWRVSPSFEKASTVMVFLPDEFVEPLACDLVEPSCRQDQCP